MKITIENLANCPQHIDTVVEWLYSEWGDNNFAFWDSWVKSSLQKSSVPQTFVIFVDDNLAGTYSLWRCDLQSRQDLFPWFGGLYVSCDFRGQYFDGKKLGSVMLEHATEQLKSLGHNEAFLFTEKSPRYYIRNGWTFIGEVPDEKGNTVSLCRIEL